MTGTTYSGALVASAHALANTSCLAIPPSDASHRRNSIALRSRIFFVIRLCKPMQPDPSSSGPAAARRGGALCKFGRHDAAESQPALIHVDGAPDVLAVHVVQQTVDGLRIGGIVD